MWSRSPLLLAALALGACGQQPKILPSGGGGASGGSSGSGGGGGGPPLDAFFVVTDSQPGPTTDGPTGTVEKNCGLTTVKLEKNPPELLLVFDSLSSMNIVVPGTANSRWTEAKTAIADAITRTEKDIFWGLKLFPGAMYCGLDMGVDAPIAPMNAAVLNQTILTGKPPVVSAGTPTSQAVDAAVAILKARATSARKYLVLATDGEPDCAGGLSDQAAITAVQNAAAATFPTFVVGIATAMTNADRVLNAMAMAGGQPRAGATAYYSAVNKDELATALAQITAQVISCVFTLGSTPPSPDDVAVNVNGARIGRGNDGWTYGPGMTTLEIHGASCDLLKSAMTSDVSIIFGCPNVPIP